MKQILIRPVQLAVSEENTVLASLALGSSLAVCMYDVNRHIGGMVHTLLPRVPEKEAAGQELRYVDTSIVALYDAMMAKAPMLTISGQSLPEEPEYSALRPVRNIGRLAGKMLTVPGRSSRN